MSIKFSTQKKNKQKFVHETRQDMVNNIVNSQQSMPDQMLANSPMPQSENFNPVNNMGSHSQNKKIFILLGTIIFILLIALAVVLLFPEMVGVEEPEPEATTATPAPVAKPVQAATPASAPPASAATNNDNLRTETIVISGEQLGDAATAASVSSEQSNLPAPAINTEQPQAEPAPLAKAEQIQKPADDIKPTLSNPSAAPVDNGQNSMSYTDFVKASEQTVFADR